MQNHGHFGAEWRTGVLESSPKEIGQSLAGMCTLTHLHRTVAHLHLRNGGLESLAANLLQACVPSHMCTCVHVSFMCTHERDMSPRALTHAHDHRVPSHMCTHTWMRHATDMPESCQTCDRVMSHRTPGTCTSHELAEQRLSGRTEQWFLCEASHASQRHLWKSRVYWW